MISLSPQRVFGANLPLRLIVLSVAVFAVTVRADAGIVATISTTPLANNSTGQTLSVFLESDTGALTDVQGVNLHAWIGDGTAGQTTVPTFESFTWDPTFQSSLTPFGSQTPEGGNNFRGTEGLFGLGPVTTVGATPTLIGSFSIDTTGIMDAVIPFRLLSDGGSTSDVFSVAGGGTLPYTFTGSFSVGSSVPEPSTFALLGLGGLGLLVRQRRRKSAVAVQAS